MEAFDVRIRNEKAKIVCVGLDYVGYDFISHIPKEILVDVDLVAIVTEAKLLSLKNEAKIIHINFPFEKYNEVSSVLQDADLVFIINSLEENTGATINPIVSQIAKKQDALTVSIIIIPSKFEDQKKYRVEENDLENIKKSNDVVALIQHEKLTSIIGKDYKSNTAFKLINNILIEETINGMINSLFLDGNINDYNHYDLKNKGLALMGIGEYKGSNSAQKAIKQSLSYPLIDDISMRKATVVMIYFTIHPNHSMTDIVEAINNIYDNNIHDEVDIFWGLNEDKSLSEDYAKASIIVTGFES